jgi:thymidine phosphorylase
MIVIPIVAACGVLIPKTSSRAITSPSGTADTMEVLAPVSFSVDKIKALKDQLRGHKIATRETESFEREKARIRTKLEKLRTKIQKLITSEPVVTAPPSPLGDLFDEKSN